jgi:photosystem II stability/assembly factor-like uncharacterized protein
VAIGDSSGKGMVFRTNNGGANWTVQNRSIGTIFDDVYFVSADTGIVVGAGGTILRTTNGGASWTKLAGLPGNALLGVHFVTHRIGTAVGQLGTILRSVDGGANWVNQTNPSYGLPLQSVYFTNPDNGFAVGYLGYILRTTNAGVTWTKVTSGTSETLNSVSFADADTGVVVGNNSIILRSINKGLTWSKLTVPGLPSALTLEWVHFVNDQVGYISGANGTTLRTENAGRTWRLLASLTSSSINAVDFIDSFNGIAVGDQGTVLRTSDGGLPVELVSFTGTWAARQQSVTLVWKTATEIQNYGFKLERKIAGVWDEIAFIPGHGTTVEPKTYSFVDKLNRTECAVSYRLWQVDLDGATSLMGAVSVSLVHAVESFRLAPCFPNPFNNATRIPFDLDKPGHVRLTVYNATGQAVATLVDREMTAGNHVIPWMGDGLASGIYLVRLEQGSLYQIQKMVLLR